MSAVLSLQTWTPLHWRFPISPLLFSQASKPLQDSLPTAPLLLEQAFSFKRSRLRWFVSATRLYLVLVRAIRFPLSVHFHLHVHASGGPTAHAYCR